MRAGPLSSWPEQGSDLLSEMGKQLIRGVTQIILLPQNFAHFSLGGCLSVRILSPIPQQCPTTHS